MSSGANSGRSGGSSNGGGGGGGSRRFSSHETSSVSSSKIGSPAWVGSSASTVVDSSDRAVGLRRSARAPAARSRVRSASATLDRRHRRRRRAAPGCRARTAGSTVSCLSGLRRRDRRGQPGVVADEVAEEDADAAGAGDVADVADPAALGVEQFVAQVVERARDAGADLARSQHPAVVARHLRHDRGRVAGPLAGERGVQEPGQVADVGAQLAGRQAVQGGVDAEADDPDRAGVVDQDVLGHQAAVRDRPGVRGRDRVGDLATIHAASRGASGPLVASMMSSEVPEPHSLTTKQYSSVRSASSTRRNRASRTVAERRAASSSRSARSSSAAMTCSATWRSRIRSWARQKRPWPLSLSRSTRR